MDDGSRTARWALWIVMAVLAVGCRAAEEDLPLEVQVWRNVRVMRESIGMNGFQIEGLPPGWGARLTPWHIQGINPRILFVQLELVPGEPNPDEDAEAATWVECGFGQVEVWAVTPEGFIRLRGERAGR